MIYYIRIKGESMEHTAGEQRAWARGLSPVALAFVGDSVYELLVREALARAGAGPSGRLHTLAVERVRAAAQAARYDRLLELAAGDELEILRRGRNATLSRLPASCTPEQYHKATALEALFGYLYLAGDEARLRELCALLERGEAS
jgi:ribonuclease-3 family protein